MDIYKAIQELKSEKQRIDRAIAALETKNAIQPRRRGGRSWNADARRAAAARMKKYWEQRRQQSAAGAPNDYNVSPPSTESA